MMIKRVMKLILLPGLKILFIFVFLNHIAYANIIDVGNGVLWDNSTDKYWFQDLTHFTGMNFDEQLNEIAKLNLSGPYLNDRWETWRMATIYEMSDLFYDEQGGWDSLVLGEITELFTPTIGNYCWSGRAAYDLTPQSYFYHSTPTLTDYGAGTGIHSFVVEISGIEDFDYTRSDYLSAWVVADANPSFPVPEPSTFFLLGSGLIFFVICRKGYKWVIVRN